jgi:REP element-mobilizing transposase RayT
MNRAAGYKGDQPLTREDREKGMNIVFRLSQYYLLEFISMCWMGNHFHIILYAPSQDEQPDIRSIAERHNAFFENRPFKHVDCHDIDACTTVAEKMRDISHFMKVFQQAFTSSFNKSKGRRGHFWADRFKSTILQGREALWTAVKYVELNPVRAGIVSNPADYRHSTWGWYCGSGKHPFKSFFHKHLCGSLGEGNAESWSFDELCREFRGELARTIAYEENLTSEEINEEIEKARKNETMPIRFLRRTRHFTDGGIIGSKRFIQETATLFREKKKVMKKQFSRGRSVSGYLYCFKNLRASLE